MHWRIGKPFFGAPWDRPLPGFRDWLKLLVFGFLFLLALQPYLQFGHQEGWLAAGVKLVQDVIQDCEAAYQSGREHHTQEGP